MEIALIALTVLVSLALVIGFNLMHSKVEILTKTLKSTEELVLAELARLNGRVVDLNDLCVDMMLTKDKPRAGLTVANDQDLYSSLNIAKAGQNPPKKKLSKKPKKTNGN